MELDLLHYVLIGGIFGTGLGTVWFVHRVIAQRRSERDALDQVLIAVGYAVREIDAFAKEEHRTMESLNGLPGNNFDGAVGRAKLRGMEVYRNGYVTRRHTAISDALRHYNSELFPLLDVLGYEVVQNDDGTRSVLLDAAESVSR